MGGPTLAGVVPAAVVPAGASGAVRTALLSVVVCTAGRRPSLFDLLRGLAEQDDPCYEVVVVENSPRPALPSATLAALGARHVVERRVGLDVARNRGLAAAEGDLIAYVDDDCLVSPGWLSALRRAFDDESVDLVTGRVVPHSLTQPSERAFQQAFPWDRGVRPQRFDATTSAEWFPASAHHLGTGCNMAFRREVLEALGGFDEALDMGTLIGGGGDMDVFERALDAGKVAAYEPEALVRHRHRGTMRDLRWQVWGYGVSQGATMAKGVLRRRRLRRAVLTFWLFRLSDRLRRLGRAALGDRSAPRSALALEAAGMLVGPVVYPVSVLQAWLRRRLRS
jgi:GT2 family glycosyltransferase